MKRHTKRNSKGQFAKSPGFVAQWVETNGAGLSLILFAGGVHILLILALAITA